MKGVSNSKSWAIVTWNLLRGISLQLYHGSNLGDAPWRIINIRRWNISLRKKSNAKCKSVFERLHQVKNYDWWLIYKFQNPDNFDDPYFSFEEFVEKEVLDTEQDKELDSEEDPLEPSEETNSSSED